jgi:hypothetical protein
LLGPGGRQQLFDLAQDPSEQTDVLARGGIILRILRAGLAWQHAYERRWRRTRWGTGVNLEGPFALDLGM